MDLTDHDSEVYQESLKIGPSQAIPWKSLFLVTSNLLFMREAINWEFIDTSKMYTSLSGIRGLWHRGGPSPTSHSSSHFFVV